MFANLIFLILVLFVVNLAPESEPGFLGLAPSEAFLYGLGLYGFCTFLIVLTTRILRHFDSHLEGAGQLLTQLLLLGFLAVYHLVFAAHTFYADVPPFSHSNVCFGLVPLGFYFGGLGVFHYFMHQNRYQGPSPSSLHRQYALQQLRFIVPFLLPFLIYQGTLDLLRLIPNTRLQEILSGTGDHWIDGLITAGFTLLFLIGLMIFLPAVIQKVWQCESLPPSPIRDRLEALCKRAEFRYAGFKLWTVMNHSLTAAIIGIVPRYRYVMFSEGLLEELSPAEVEAVLAHEMGHSYHRHLLIYPFIFLGMMLSGGLFFLFMHDTLIHFFALQEQLGHGEFWRAFEPLAIFLPYAIIMGAYFRIVFGYFSRLFERQADIHPLSIGVSGEDMINALNRVGVASGGTHHHPSWHHFSLQERMEFLYEATAHPEVAAEHHKRVKRNVRSYFVILAIVATLFLSASYPKAPGLTWVNQFTRSVSRQLNFWVNHPIRQKLSRRYQDNYQLQGDETKLDQALEQSFEAYEALTVSGVAEFYAAQRLHQSGENRASLILMTAAWKKFDFAAASPEVPEDFRAVTYRILKASEKEPGLLLQRMNLFQAMQDAREGLPIKIDSHTLLPSSPYGSPSI